MASAGPTPRDYDLLIGNATLIAGDYPYAVLEQHAIGIRGDRIAAIGPTANFSEAVAARSINAHGKLAFPGLANTHTHLFQTLLKGLGEAQDPRVISARDTLRLAAEGGAAALALRDELGSIEVGKLADCSCSIQIGASPRSDLDAGLLVR